MQFVKDLIAKLPQTGNNSLSEATKYSQLSICSAILQVCVQDNYKNLIVGEHLEERLGWFVTDVLFVLAESLKITADSSLTANPKKTMQLQCEIAGSLVDLSMRVEAVRKKTITKMCTLLLLDHPLKFLNVPPNQRTF